MPKTLETSDIIVPAPQTISIRFSRKGGKLQFSFAISAKIQNLYRDYDFEVRTSSKWEGLKFYYIPGLTDSKHYREKLESFNLFDDYGQPLLKEGKLNIAWLRTVGGEGSIEIGSSVGFSEMAQLVKKAVEFLKEYFADFYREYTIRGNVQVDI